MVAGLKLPPINGASSENIKKFQNGDGAYISHEVVAALISVAIVCFLESKRQARTELKSCLSYLPNWKVGYLPVYFYCKKMTKCMQTKQTI